MRSKFAVIAGVALSFALASCSSGGDGDVESRATPVEDTQHSAENAEGAETAAAEDTAEPQTETSTGTEAEAEVEASCADPYAGEPGETDEKLAEYIDRFMDDENVHDLGEETVVDYHDGVQNHNFDLTINAVAKTADFEGEEATDGCYLVAQIEAHHHKNDYLLKPPYVMRNVYNADRDVIRTVNDELDVELTKDDDGATHGLVVYEISDKEGTESPFFTFSVGHDDHVVIVRQDEFTDADEVV
ncbi:MAG TPA: hypothetical protein VK086_07230 [Ruania sp.]|nr:hypothetical protein [Ruania sp.]